MKVLYSSSVNGLVVEKGEIMTLLRKTDLDWWKVRKSNGDINYMPSNRLEEVESRLIKIPVRRKDETAVEGTIQASDGLEKLDLSKLQSNASANTSSSKFSSGKPASTRWVKVSKVFFFCNSWVNNTISVNLNLMRISHC